jgi:hypothetical protein
MLVFSSIVFVASNGSITHVKTATSDQQQHISATSIHTLSAAYATAADDEHTPFFYIDYWSSLLFYL